MSKNVDQYMRHLEEIFATGLDVVQVKRSVDYVARWLDMDNKEQVATGAEFREHAYKVVTVFWKWHRHDLVLKLAGEVLSRGLADEKFSRLVGQVVLAPPAKKPGKKRGRPKSVPELEIAQAYGAVKKAHEEAGIQASPSLRDVIEQLKALKVHVELKNGKSGIKPAGYMAVGETEVADAITRYNAVRLSDIEGGPNFRRLAQAVKGTE
jgi:hypothetical protein